MEHRFGTVNPAADTVTYLLWLGCDVTISYILGKQASVTLWFVRKKIPPVLRSGSRCNSCEQEHQSNR